MFVARFLLLVVVLNVLRYVVGGLVESALIFPRLMGAMEASPAYFNAEFTTLDWITSFTYNFVMWLTIVWTFHLMRPRLRGVMSARA